MSRFAPHHTRGQTRLAFKRRPGESVVVGGVTRVTVVAIRRDGGHPIGVRLHLANTLPDGRVGDVTFDLRTGDAAPVGEHMTLHLRMAYGGPQTGRCRLMFEGPPGVSVVRGEVERRAPAAAAAGTGTGGAR